MALSLIYYNKFSFETFDVISVWLLLCYKSSSTVRASITDPGMTLMHRDQTVWGPVATTKNIYFNVYLSLSDLTFASNREGIDNPFITLGASCLIVCVGIWWFVRCLLLDWYLGSQTEGNTYLYFAASPFPLHGKTNASSRSSNHVEVLITRWTRWYIAWPDSQERGGSWDVGSSVF